MTGEQKKQAAIIGGVVLVEILLFLLFRKRGNTVITNNGALPGLAPVTIGGITINRTPFNIPGLSIGPEYERLSAIGACCSDCAGSRPRVDYAPANGPSITFVTNEGNKGPNIYNYITPTPAPVKKTGTWFATGGFG